MKSLISKMLFSLALLVCLVDIFNQSSGIIHLATGLVSSIFIFYLGISEFKLNKTKTILLFAANIVVFLVTARYKVYLINMILLSYCIWSFITPMLAKYRHILSAAAVSAFLAVYYFSLSGMSIPLFPIVFFPSYVFGYMIKYLNFQSSKLAQLKVLMNILFSGAVLAVLFYKVLGLHIIDNISFLKIYKPGAKTAVYMPFITMFFLWLSLSLNLFLYNLTDVFKTNLYNKEELSLNSDKLKNDILNLIGFLFIIGLFVVAGEYTLRGQLAATLKNVLDPYAMFNILFLSTIYLALITFIGRGLSTVLISVICLILLAANSLKIRYFNEPFYPWDTYLMKNALSISKDYINLKVIAILAALVIVLAFTIIKSKTFLKKSLRPRLYLPLLPVVVSLAFTNIVILNNPAFLSDLNIQKSWYVGKAEVLANGFYVQNYFYITDLDKYLYSKPEGYSLKKMEEISKSLSLNKPVHESTKVKPNIVVIMNESFWDPTQLKNISYSEDITKNLKKYQNGEIVSPVIGGGTANTEFEALTGLSMSFINTGVITYNVYLRRDTPSIASVLKDNGYSTFALHPNSGWFYNRDKVYKYFGFDDFIDIKGFNINTDIKGTHVSDEKFVDKILGILNKDDDKPKFIFAVSIENHDPYLDKYKDLEVHAKSDKLDETEINILSNYAQGIYDADKSLGKLIDSLSKTKTPTLVYFFGDHLPRLGSLQAMYDIYNKLNASAGTEISPFDIRFYKTPFVKWSNFKDMAPVSAPISASQIADEILIDSNVDYPDYFNVLHSLRSEYPVLHTRLNNKVDLNNEFIKDYKLIQYDLLFGEQYLKSIK